MIEINLTEDHKQFRQTIREFALKELAPLVDETELRGRYPMELIPKAADIGLIGLTVPTALGGGGAGLSFLCVATEELARVSPSLATPLMGGLGMTMLARYATKAQQDKYLAPLLEGKTLSAFAMTEPEAGSDVLAMHGVAERTDSGWHIRASKMFITAAPICDFFFLVVYTDKAARAHGVSIFLVDSKTPGIDVSMLDKLGHRGMDTGAVFFDIEVPTDALLGEAGAGMRYIKETLTEGRLSHAARSLGVARSAFEAASEHAKIRKTFGRPIVQHQAIQFKLSRLLVDIRSAALQVMYAAEEFEREGHAEAAASAAKLVASEIAVRAASEAMQIVGGGAYMMDSPVQRMLRDSYLYPVSEGTTEIQLRTLARLNGLTS